MSLINDALKRAKEAQQKSSPAAAGPQFRPAEPAQPATPGMAVAVPLVLLLLVFLGALFLWLNRQKAAAREPITETKPVAPIIPAPEAKPPVQTVAAVAPAPVVKEQPVIPPVAPSPVATVSAPPLKLQAIFFSPGHSSAIINGKTVRAGDAFKGFHVAAITESSATLVSATETNVMTLEQ